MAIVTLTVACVKAKPYYDHKWVNRLYRAVQRHLTLPHRFVCMTDDSSAIQCYTKKLPADVQGWWAKIALFRKGVFDGPVLYLDLDTVITDSLDFVGEYKGDFAILRDFYRDDGYGSGVMLWNKPVPHVWENWVAQFRPQHALGDQGWMEEQIQNADRLQDVFPGKFVSYKVDCAARDALPEGAAVVCMHGEPKNHQFPEAHWVSRAWRGEGERAAA